MATVNFNEIFANPNMVCDTNLSLIHQHLKENALFTGSKCFFGEGEDEDYVVTFDDLLVMEKLYPYTAAIITNDKQGREGDTYKFHSSKFEVNSSLINVIVVKKNDYKDWMYATEQFLKNCKRDYFKIKEHRVKQFEAYKEESRQRRTALTVESLL